MEKIKRIALYKIIGQARDKGSVFPEEISHLRASRETRSPIVGEFIYPVIGFNVSRITRETTELRPILITSFVFPRANVRWRYIFGWSVTCALKCSLEGASTSDSTRVLIRKSF